jgi:hypothetical protein
MTNCLPASFPTGGCPRLHSATLGHTFSAKCSLSHLPSNQRNSRPSGDPRLQSYTTKKKAVAANRKIQSGKQRTHPKLAPLPSFFPRKRGADRPGPRATAGSPTPQAANPNKSPTRQTKDLSKNWLRYPGFFSRKRGPDSPAPQATAQSPNPASCQPQKSPTRQTKDLPKNWLRYPGFFSRKRGADRPVRRRPPGPPPGKTARPADTSICAT